MKDLTPARIVQALDRHIVGQHDAKKAVAIALRNRWRRMHAPAELRNDIIPSNILLIGATGVGKTEIARRLAELAQAPFIKVEASKFTEVGYVGRDVESMVRDLVEQSVRLVRAEKIAEHKEKATQLAEDAILDLLIPPVTTKAAAEPSRMGFSADRPFDPSTASDAELNERTREKFRHKLRNGELDERMVEVEVTVTGNGMQVFTPMGLDQPGMEGLQDMLQNLAPKRKKARKMTVAEARAYLIDEEAQKLLDNDAVQREALERAGNSGIIFIDEIDKVANRNRQSGGADVSREGVQRDLLPVVEGTTVNTKYGPINTDHVLFIAAGAFHLSKPSDLIPELQGRFPIRVELQPLTQADFERILTQPHAALIKQYQSLLASEGVTLTFAPDAIQEIAAIAYQVNLEVENIGARRLQTVLSNLLDDILFTVPDVDPTPAFTITRDMVQAKLGKLVQQRDLSQYIL